MAFPYRVGAPVGVRVGTRPAPGVTPEAAGPVWQGGRAWLPDGVGSWQVSGFPVFAPYEVLVRAKLGTGTAYYFSTVTSVVSRLTAIQGYKSYRQARVKRSGATSFVNEASGAVAVGNYHLQAAWRISGAGQVPAIGQNGGAQAVGGTTIGLIGDTGTLVLGAQRNETGTWYFSSAGSPIWDAHAWPRLLTDTERTAMAAGQIDPLTVAPDAWGSWDMANATAAACPDLLLGDGTRDLAAVNMTPTFSEVAF